LPFVNFSVYSDAQIIKFFQRQGGLPSDQRCPWTPSSCAPDHVIRLSPSKPRAPHPQYKVLKQVHEVSYDMISFSLGLVLTL